MFHTLKHVQENDIATLVRAVSATPSPVPADSQVDAISHHIYTIASMLDPNVANPMNVDSQQLFISVLFILYSSIRVCAKNNIYRFSWRRFYAALASYKHTIITLMVAKLLFWLSYYL